MSDRRSVDQLLNDLATGRVTLDDVAADFRTRDWPPLARRMTDEEKWRGDDPIPDPSGSFFEVSAARVRGLITPYEYTVLADAAGGHR